MKKTTLAMATLAVMGWHGPTRAEVTLEKRCAHGIHENSDRQTLRTPVAECSVSGLYFNN